MVTVPGVWLHSRYLAPGCRVLDLGCGTGLLLELLAVQPEDYLGIDPSEKMLDEFRRKFPEHETKKKAEMKGGCQVMLGLVGFVLLWNSFQNWNSALKDMFVVSWNTVNRCK